MIDKEKAIGNCVAEELVEELFGSVSEFARLVEENGDNFETNKIVVKYEETTGIHWFFCKTWANREGEIHCKCPKCGRVNETRNIGCWYCGEPIARKNRKKSK